MEDKKKSPDVLVMGVTDTMQSHMPIHLVDDEHTQVLTMPPKVEEPPKAENDSKTTIQPYLKSARKAGFLGMAAALIANMVFRGGAAGGMRLPPRPANKKISTAKRKLKAMKRHRIEMQKASRRANRGTKGHTKRIEGR